MEKIIIDTDIGVDDSFAIYYGAKTCQLLGLTTVSGNVDVDQATKNAKFFVDKIGIDCNVYKGMSRPLVKPNSEFATIVHGKDGLGEVFDNTFDSNADDAIDFIIKTVMKNPHEVTLVPIGPLTNIAIALNKEPKIAKLIKRIVLMGGAFGTDGNSGNATPLAEFNIYKDPHAADQILSSDIDVTIVPLDVTHKVNLTEEEIKKTCNDTLIKISKFYLDFNQRVEGFNGMCVHDALTIAYILHPEYFTEKIAPTRVVCGGICDGQTIMRTTMMGVNKQPFENIKDKRILVGVEVDKVKESLLKTLSL